MANESVIDKEIIDAIDALKEAKNDFKDLENELKSEPDLLPFYLPSYKELINGLENNLKSLITEKTGSNELNKDTVDVWVHIGGPDFKNGQGPIGQIGYYLNKLSNANAQAVDLLLKSSKHKIENAKTLIPTFNLVVTDSGSLKIGLKSGITNLNIDNQLSLFDEEIETDSIVKAKELGELSATNIKAFKLLGEAILSADHAEILNSLKAKFGEKELLKLIYYAKDLAPSNRSDMEYISFEGPVFDQRIIKTDKKTRKKLSERAKELMLDTKYIEAKAAIREIDFDRLTATARPLIYKNDEICGLKLKFSSNVLQSTLHEISGKTVSLSGFLNYDRTNDPIDLSVEEITLDDDE